MRFAEKFYKLLDEKWGERGGQKDLICMTGMNQARINKVFTRETKDPGLSTVSAIVDVIGLENFLDEAFRDCAGVRQQLAEANERIAALEKELYQAQGEVRSLQGICDRAMGLLAQKQSTPPANTQGKSYALPESNTEQNVG